MNVNFLTTRVILVRHGQTEWNREERFRGQADVPLNDVGLAQAEATGKRIAAEWKPMAIYSSPLSRAHKTAEAIAQHFALPVQTHPNLIDIDYGQWQGLTPDEVKIRWAEDLHKWYVTPSFVQIPGGETLREVRARGFAVINELVSRYKGKTIVLVGHTVINRLILLTVLGLATERFWHIKQDTCAVNTFEAVRGDFVLGSLNDTYHLSTLKESEKHG